MKKIYTFRQPDNWHAHLREGELLALIVSQFNLYGRVLCMGNLKKLIETADEAFSYRQEIINQGALFDPVMCIMLTRNTTPKIIYEAAARGIKFVKFIPGGTSYGGSDGLALTDAEPLIEIFRAITETGMHLLIHAELKYSEEGHEIHLLEREEEAIGMISAYHSSFPEMKITIEHVSTAVMIEFIKSKNSPNLRATLTPQHALLTYSDVFDNRDKLIHPLNSCLPVAKSESDRLAVEQAMVSGDKRFFYGTDAAAHWLWRKLDANPPPGVFFGECEYL